MKNTEVEKITLLGHYNITVIDNGKEYYNIKYKNTKIKYRKSYFKNFNTSDVVKAILTIFKLDKDRFFKEQFLIENNISKYWMNSSFFLIKEKHKIRVPYNYLIDYTYEKFVKMFSEKYELSLEMNPTGNYIEAKYDDDEYVTTILKKYKKVETETVSDLKNKKENIKNILISKKYLEI